MSQKKYISSDTFPTSHLLWKCVKKIERRNNTTEIYGNNIWDLTLVADKLTDSTRPHKTSSFTPKSYNADFSMRELVVALKFGKPSAPNPNKIPYSFHPHPTVLKFLLNLFNKIWYEGESWHIRKMQSLFPYPISTRTQKTCQTKSSHFLYLLTSRKDDRRQTTAHSGIKQPYPFLTIWFPPFSLQPRPTPNLHPIHPEGFCLKQFRNCRLLQSLEGV